MKPRLRVTKRWVRKSTLLRLVGSLLTVAILATGLYCTSSFADRAAQRVMDRMLQFEVTPTAVSFQNVQATREGALLLGDSHMPDKTIGVWCEPNQRVCATPGDRSDLAKRMMTFSENLRVILFILLSVLASIVVAGIFILWAAHSRWKFVSVPAFGRRERSAPLEQPELPFDGSSAETPESGSEQD